MNKLVRFDPLAELEALQKQFFNDDWLTPVQGITVPTTDVYTDNKGLTVEAHLPNFNQEDVNISVDEGSLVIQAEKHEKEEDKKRRYVVRESSSSFYRRINLPKQADTGAIKAHLDDGVLKVTVPFKEVPAPKKIAIQSKAKKN